MDIDPSLLFLSLSLSLRDQSCPFGYKCERRKVGDKRKERSFRQFVTTDCNFCHLVLTGTLTSSHAFGIYWPCLLPRQEGSCDL